MPQRGEPATARGAPDLLKAALGRSPEGSHGDFSASVFDPTLVGIDGLATSDLSQYRCIVLDDVLPTSADVVDRLFDYTARGGGLWLILGENVTSEQFNSLVFRDGGGLLPLALGSRIKASDDHNRFFSIHPPEGPGIRRRSCWATPVASILMTSASVNAGNLRFPKRQTIWRSCWKPVTVPHWPSGISPETDESSFKPFPPDRLEQPSVVPGLRPARSRVDLVSHGGYGGQPQSRSRATDRRFRFDGQGRSQAQVQTPLEQTIDVNRTGEGESRFRRRPFPETISSRPRRPTDRTSGFLLSCVATRKSRGSCPLSAEQIAAISQSGSTRFLSDGLTLPEGDKNPVRYQPFWSYVLILLAEYS